jgi:chemotaxis protein MotB
MTALARRTRRQLDIWPGFVDALATLLMVIIFLLMVFVLAQFFLNEALSGRDAALRTLQGRLAELADALALERDTGAERASELSRLQATLAATLAEREGLQRALADAQAARSQDQARLAGATGEIARLAADVAALQALKAELEKEAAALAGKAAESGAALIEERRLSESARAQLALLNQQLSALRTQIEALNEALAVSERKAAEQGAEIASLGQRLNAALASKVTELARYRSEFFGRLREVLGDRPGVRIVGDRFVFQSEVLFPQGSASIEPEGRVQLQRVARTLKDVMPRIPGDLDWVLQVEGHTDRLPINTPQFPSNWELSAARAISVIRVLNEAGIPISRLAAAGFAEYHPLEPGTDEAALRRNRRIELKLSQR